MKFWNSCFFIYLNQSILDDYIILLLMMILFSLISYPLFSCYIFVCVWNGNGGGFLYFWFVISPINIWWLSILAFHLLLNATKIPPNEHTDVPKDILKVMMEKIVSKIILLLQKNIVIDNDWIYLVVLLLLVMDVVI